MLAVLTLETVSLEAVSSQLPLPGCGPTDLSVAPSSTHLWAFLFYFWSMDMLALL